MTIINRSTSDLVSFLTTSLPVSPAISETATDVKNSNATDILSLLDSLNHSESTDSFYNLLLSSANASLLKTNTSPLKAAASDIEASAESVLSSEDLATLLQGNYQKWE